MEISNVNFDCQNPPSPQLIDACVHCGFCLSNCPSYRVIGKEMDSPRGRIYLMKAINQGEASFDKVTTQHFDSCLGCLACVTTCPSGVKYDQLIMSTRAQVERNHPRSTYEQFIRAIIFNLFPYPNRLRVLLPFFWLYQKSQLQPFLQKLGILKTISPHLAAMDSLLPQVNLSDIQQQYPTIIPAIGKRRYRVGMILGCVQRLFFSEVNLATIRVLSANGCEVVIPQSQGCCSALPAHQGQEKQAQELAKQMIDSFAHSDTDYVIINAAGCGHTLKDYEHILQDAEDSYREKANQFSTKVRDIQEFLVEIGITSALYPIADEDLTIVYQDACHLLHGQGISAQPRDLLLQIPGIILKEPVDAALCCGSAGVFNMLQPQIAQELGQSKLDNLLQTGAQLIASSNPGCSLQLSNTMRSQHREQIPIKHPVELLDFSIRGVKLYPKIEKAQSQ